MVERRRISRGMSLQKLVRRTSPPLLQDSPENKRSAANVLQHLTPDDLVQGSLYIVKLRQITVSLFHGWDDDMCCFSILRADVAPLRWSEARYLPGDFEAYPAFDASGNPPMKLWTRVWRRDTPTNWFAMFEEARRKQREWTQREFPSMVQSTDVIDPSVVADGSTPMYFLQSVSTLATDQRPVAASRPTSTYSEAQQQEKSPVPQTKEMRKSSSLTISSSASSAVPSVDASTAVAAQWQSKVKAIFNTTVPVSSAPSPTPSAVTTPALLHS